MLPESWTCYYHGAPSADGGLIEQILAEQPDLVAVSALTASIEEAYWFCERIREAGVPVVIGGLHATVCAEEASRYCDAVVIGEGETVWQELLADAEAGRLRPIYQAGRGQTEPAWPLPRFDLLGPNPPRFTLQTQRGCPLACDFCGASRLLGRFREKPIEAIQRELDAICEITPNPLIELADDNTFAGHRDVAPFFDAFEQSGARWFTEADWRIGERPEVLARLAEAGCVQVLVGIESLVFRYPGLGQKQADLDRIMQAVEAIQEAGVAVNGCFIVGADGETRDSLDRLVNFLIECPLAEVQVTLQTPFPGTGLYQRLRDQGRLLAKRGWPYYTLFDVTYQPDRLSVPELEAGFREVLRQVYSAEATRRRQKIRHEIWHRNARLHR
jgi:radical SAM superfamily enzyme YgiQ (UPF0313 family)